MAGGRPWTAQYLACSCVLLGPHTVFYLFFKMYCQYLKTRRFFFFFKQLNFYLSLKSLKLWFHQVCVPLGTCQWERSSPCLCREGHVSSHSLQAPVSVQEPRDLSLLGPSAQLLVQCTTCPHVPSLLALIGTCS